jgi:hypothetical protein
MAGGVTRGDAMNRLLDHQIAELAMFVSHMDGIGRAMTMMRLEAEEPVQSFAASSVRAVASFPNWTKTVR